jgi:tetratricopeptide (TPR) repeat protein
MKSLRKTGAGLSSRTVFSAAFALLSATLLGAPASDARPSKSSRTAPSKRAPEPVAKNSEKSKPAQSVPDGPPVFADAYPSETRPAPADLLLKPEDERKADAFNAFAEGLLAEDAADPDRMLAGYRRTLELDPGYAELAVKVAYELARRNDPSGGIQILKDAIKAAPKQPLPYVYLSDLYARHLKKPDLALKYAELALEIAPENFAPHRAIVDLHAGSGDQEKAEKALERAAKTGATDPKYWIQLGALQRRMYLKEDGTCEPAQLQKMNAVHMKAAELGKNDPAILTDVADYFVLSKQVKDAIPHYLAVLSADNGVSDEDRLRVRDKLARSFIVTGQRDEAITALEKIAQEHALRFETYEMLGDLYEQRSEGERQAGDDTIADASLEKAIRNYEQGLALHSSEPRTHLRLADLLMRVRKFDKAVETMQSARAKFPDVPLMKYSLAIALSQAKRHTEALAAFAETQADAQATQEELLNSSFFFSYGAAAEQAGLIDKAGELLSRAIDLDPNSPQAYNYLGYMWADRGERLDEAGELIRKAVEMDPANGAFLDSLGWYYFKKGDAEKALPELLRAAENIRREEKKDDPTVLDHIGDVYAKLDKTADALSYWQKALALGSEDKKLAEKIAAKIEDAKQKLAKGEAASAAPSPAPETAKSE